MSDIEKEFFDAFGIERSTCNFIKDNFCCGCEIARDYLPSTCPKSEYPPITSDIVLGLENILFFNCGDLTIKSKSNGVDYISYEYNLYQTSKYNLNTKAETREKSLLKLCIELKFDISEEVKALFKC